MSVSHSPCSSPCCRFRHNQCLLPLSSHQLRTTSYASSGNVSVAFPIEVIKIELKESNIWCYFSKISFLWHVDLFCDSSKFSFSRPVGGILFLRIKIQNIQHIINQFVRKRLTFPDSPYIIIRVFEVEFSIVDSDVFSEWLFIDSWNIRLRLISMPYFWRYFPLWYAFLLIIMLLYYQIFKRVCCLLFAVHRRNNVIKAVPESIQYLQEASLYDIGIDGTIIDIVR